MVNFIKLANFVELIIALHSLYFNLYYFGIIYEIVNEKVVLVRDAGIFLNIVKHLHTRTHTRTLFYYYIFNVKNV